MVIKEERSLSVAEVVAKVEDREGGDKIKKFIKKFNKMDVKKAEDIKKEIESLQILKLKDSHIVKIVDFIPKEASELNKVISDVSLDKDEIEKILNVTQKF
jgi:DNA-directed RNA polymerase subunit F